MGSPSKGAFNTDVNYCACCVKLRFSEGGHATTFQKLGDLGAEVTEPRRRLPRLPESLRSVAEIMKFQKLLKIHLLALLLMS